MVLFVSHTVVAVIFMLLARDRGGGFVLFSPCFVKCWCSRTEAQASSLQELCCGDIIQKEGEVDWSVVAACDLRS